MRPPVETLPTMCSTASAERDGCGRRAAATCTDRRANGRKYAARLRADLLDALDDCDVLGADVAPEARVSGHLISV
jgi:hypothetical protein